MLLGIRLQMGNIPILPEGRELCAAFHLDPLATIASGSLLLTAAPDQAEGIRASLAEAGIACALIGEMVEGNTVEGLPKPARDEITRLFETG